MINFRASTERDAHYLIDIDLKCFDYAWLPEAWRQVSKTCVACVATWNETPIGMAIFGKTPDGDVEILKVAVKPAYRNQGIAQHLLYNCALYAREVHAFRLIMVVPEGQLRPGEPGDISDWLTRLGFRAQVPLLKDYFVFYGQAEDGVIFSFPIPQV
jgi:ribosomal protein S18 acetylase RimI-like enzyme